MPVCVGPGRKPKLLVFSREGSSAITEAIEAIIKSQSGIEFAKRMVAGYSNRTIQGHYNNLQTLKNLQTLSDL